MAYWNEQDKLRGEPISDETMEELEQRREKLLDHYGSGFDGTWGWASHEIDGGRFKDIEEHAGYGQFYPYYKFASKANIHSGQRARSNNLRPVTDIGCRRRQLPLILDSHYLPHMLPGHSFRSRWHCFSIDPTKNTWCSY